MFSATSRGSDGGMDDMVEDDEEGYAMVEEGYEGSDTTATGDAQSFQAFLNAQMQRLGPLQV